MNAQASLAVISTALTHQVQYGVSVEDCEAWAKKETWRAASEGLPLLLGVRPADWARLLRATDCAAHAGLLWEALAAQLGIAEDQDPAVAPLKLRAAAERAGINLPPALAALLDFLARILPAAAGTIEQPAEALILAAQERETLLGAALLLVTRMPDRCVDELGYYDSAAIAKLIREKALLWFPLAPPSLNADEIAGLIAKWLPPKGTD